jgi:preprotein translocase subunit SecG
MLEEKKVVSWSLATLFLALMIVYTLMYMKKVEVFISPSPEEDMVETPVNATVHHSDTNDITTVNNGENTANSDVAVVNMHNEPTS